MSILQKKKKTNNKQFKKKLIERKMFEGKQKLWQKEKKIQIHKLLLIYWIENKIVVSFILIVFALIYTDL